MSIVIVPIGKIDREVIEPLIIGISDIFKRQVVIGKEMVKPDYAFNSKRNQYSAELILNSLIEDEKYPRYEKTLGIVDCDLYAPDLNFIFGLAGEKAAVISLTRLRQEFYGLPQDIDRFNQRVFTEAIHELGHTYGLSHCKNRKCVMFFSNNLIDTDRKGSEFCLKCRYRLYVDHVS
jgi:archaemetzincin